MPWINEDRIAAAREVDLLTYLQEREPHELVRSRSAPGEYRTASHGSLVISNGVWFWNRGGFGSRSALDYLIKIRGMGLVEAVQAVEGIGSARASPSTPSLAVEDPGGKREQKTLMLEIYLTVSIAPIPLATMANREWGQMPFCKKGLLY